MLDLRLHTKRTALRAFRATDAARLQSLIANWKIARMTGRIPYPYPEGAATAWIALQTEKRAAGTDYAFAIEVDGMCAGCVGLHERDCTTNQGDRRIMEIGYWIGQPYWGQGLVTEAAGAAVAFAFEWLAQARLVSGHFVDNAASGRVLTKLGFQALGHEMQHSVARQYEVETVRMELTRDAWITKAV